MQSVSVYISKGTLPINTSYASTPNDHVSTLLS